MEEGISFLKSILWIDFSRGELEGNGAA